MARAKSTATQAVSAAVAQALNDFNADNGKNWTFGTNWDASGTTFETFTNKYLFPKLNETAIVNVALGNRFDWLAVETDFIGQYSEEYVILDSVPVELSLDKTTTLMLERNYPKIATKLYGSGILKKLKFTLNDNIQRQQFATIGDAVSYAVNVYKKQISNINVEEEREIKGMLLDYVKNIKCKRKVTTTASFITQLYTTILNFQNNSDQYNEADRASGGTLGRFTTQSRLEDVMIVTTDARKVDILNSMIANVFNSAGLDITDHIISFDTLADVYKVKTQVSLSSLGTLQSEMQAYGDYQVKSTDVIQPGTVMTYQTKTLSVSSGRLASILPTGDSDPYFALVLDARALRYKRYTKNMLKPPFYNGEFDEVTYWIHYYSMKAISPFYNKAVIYSVDKTIQDTMTVSSQLSTKKPVAVEQPEESTETETETETE